MQFKLLALSALVLSAGLSVAQTGFSKQTYSAVLPATRDNARLLPADFNNDGRPDLLSYGTRYNQGSTVPGSVFLNNGSGGFLPPVALPGNGYIKAAKAIELNFSTGDYDIAACVETGSYPSAQDSLVIYSNNGTGSFTITSSQPVPGGSCNGIAVDDVNHDQHADVITVGYSNTSPVRNYVTVWLGNGAGKLTAQPSQSPTLDDAAKSSTFTNCGLIDVVDSDFLQNGQSSLLVTTNCRPQGQNLAGNVGTTYFGSGNASASNGSYYTFSKVDSAYEIYTQGFQYQQTSSSRPDVVFVAKAQGTIGDLVLAKNNGNGSFTFSKIKTDANFAGAAAADFNGDGLNDIVTSYSPDTGGSYAAAPMIGIYSGTANGSFTDSQDFASGTTSDYPGDVAAADFNGDGKPDIATLVYDSNTRTTSLVVYTNTQSGSTGACSAPTTINTNSICSPSNGASVSSPVSVSAASNVPNLTLNRLYLDNNSVYQTTSSTVSTPLNVGGGSHRLVLVSYNSNGQAFSSAVTFTVGSGSGCLPSSAGVRICAPASNATTSSPVTFTAGAMAQSGNISAIRVYVDNNAVLTVNNPSASKTFQISQSVTVAPGTHHLVILGYQSTGGQVSNSETFTVSGTGPCVASTTGSSVRLCTPTTAPVNSPFTVSAGAHTYQGTIAAIRVYLDNNAVALVQNPQQTTSFSISSSVSASAGRHNLVVVAYPTAGASLSARETISVQ